MKLKKQGSSSILKKRKLLIIDGNNILCRSFYANRQLTDGSGYSVGGIFGMLKTMSALARDFNVQQVYVAWDHGKSEARIKLYPDYKEHRKKSGDPAAKEDLHRQKDIMIKVLEAMPVRQVRVWNVEADDIIGVLCKLEGRKIVVSGDQDMLQLVRPNVQVYSPNEKKVITHKSIDEHLGFDRKHYLRWKSMVGDTSDGIKGIHGIGPVKATKIVTGQMGYTMGAEECGIVERNMKLMEIGLLLTKEQRKAILEQVMAQAKKACSEKVVKGYFREYEFNSLIENFDKFWDTFART